MNVLNVEDRSMVPTEHFQAELIAPGVTFRRLYPGGMAGPNRECYIDKVGGQTWSESFMFGTEDDDFIMCVPDIRLPPLQFFPMHWHDCWTLVVVLEGKCLIGDWNMEPGDVFISAPSVEYGPLLPSPLGARVLEIFGDLSLSPGGYSPEYQDHPTMIGHPHHVFKPREGLNLRNEGHTMLRVEGTSGMWKAKLEPGWSWDLGEAGDQDRGIVRDGRLSSGEARPSHQAGDASGFLVIDGSIEVLGRTLVRDDVLIVERGAEYPALKGGAEGAQLIEFARTARGIET
ncbi:MAG: hypothetical protein P8J20_19460 [Novosphingobium sp.]|nr:hypothetical protein [Novosphingobium sp.]